MGPQQWEPSQADAEIKINSPDATTLVVLSRVFGALTSQAPHLQFNITNLSMGRLDRLTKGEFYIAIDFFEQVPSNFFRQPLLTDRMVCIIGDKHPIAQSDFDIGKFFSWLHVRLATASTVLLENHLAKRDIYPKYILTVPNFVVAASTLTGTNWMVMLPHNLGRYAQKLFQIKILELPFEITKILLGMVWHERLDRDPCQAWFRG